MKKLVFLLWGCLFLNLLQAQLLPNTCSNPLRLCKHDPMSRHNFASLQSNTLSEAWVEVYVLNAQEITIQVGNNNTNSTDRMGVEIYGPLNEDTQACGVTGPICYSNTLTNWNNNVSFPIPLCNPTVPAISRYLIRLRYDNDGQTNNTIDISGMGSFVIYRGETQSYYCDQDASNSCYDAFRLTTANNYDMNGSRSASGDLELWSSFVFSHAANAVMNMNLMATVYGSGIEGSVSVYGPFNGCELPCDFIAQNERLVFDDDFEVANNYSLFSQGDLPASFTAGRYYVVVHLENLAGNNLITLDASGAGLLNEIPTSVDSGQNSYSSPSEAIVVCDEFGSMAVNVNATGPGQVWGTFIAQNGSDFSFVYNENVEGICQWQPSTPGANNAVFGITVYGPFGQCAELGAINFTTAPIVFSTSVDVVQSYQDLLFDQDDWSLTDYHSRYVFKITYPTTFCTNCFIPISYSTSGLLCDWPVEEEEEFPLPGANCETAYHFCGVNQTVDFQHNGQGPVEIWLASLATSNAMPSLTFVNNGNFAKCITSSTPYVFEMYGPIGECGNPCQQLANMSGPIYSNEGNLPPLGNAILATAATLQGVSALPDDNSILYKYYFKLKINTNICGPCTIKLNLNGGNGECDWTLPMPTDLPCENCLPSFGPSPGEPYVVTAWVKVKNAPIGTKTYGGPIDGLGNPEVKIIIHPIEPGQGADTELVPAGPIIEGWQQINGVFTMPMDGGVEIVPKATMETYFDDVRLFPDNGSMKCYVYDPVNLRFIAELDERHFATFYEYDEEGRLTRIKKETERGVMTIQESRMSSPKKAAN